MSRKQCQNSVSPRYRGLRPWRRGQTGNPNGRPKGFNSVVRALRESLENNPTLAQQLAERAVQRAIKGDFKFWQEIVNRIDGKVPDVIQAEHLIKGYEGINPDEV